MLAVVTPQARLLSINAPSVEMPTILHPLSPVDLQALVLILSKIVTPNHADAFEHELFSLDLLDNFPLLADHIQHGFPTPRAHLTFQPHEPLQITSLAMVMTTSLTHSF